MKFTRYPSLTNHYAIGKTRDLIGKLDDEYYATEKNHGTNIQLTVDKNLRVGVGKRSTFITDEKPYSDVFELSEDIIAELQGFIAENADIEQVTLYGELFGSGVQKTDYQANKDKERQVRFYDCFIHFTNGKIIASKKDLYELVKEEFVAKIIKTGKLIDLVKEELPKESTYGGNTFEGYVYKPNVDNYVLNSNNNGIYYPVVKHKTEDFSEVRNKVKIELGEEEIKLHNLVESYITKNRVVNVLSHGDIELIPQNIGEIIKLVQEDIKKELIKENPEVDKNLVYQIVRKKGSLIVPLIKKIMFEEVE
ncbi:Rnl2 family RNA ligase [Helcococcus kunzii ATCC 51366]|uniref:Rnl2 family RNA ligase n=1 Tax=Helcococcus kunzii ATCC 51366 TaxID=883114 RepID=H3NPE5_9FIRM|nr:RNA ligase family protein [Helcococcus kunzii]EHR33458.1 Rnl2 family RNA ligase [Helcococcus kunzii ATCC 51366]